MATAAQRAKWARDEQKHLAAHQVILAQTGEVIVPNFEIRSFRGEWFSFVEISRAPGDGTATNGKLIMRPINGGPDREFYPSVFGLEVVRRPGATSPYDV